MSLETVVRFPAGDLLLDGRVNVPFRATTACVLCHPHPTYGGNMHNSVVVALAEAIAASGIATLRFDFRGVGSSTGSHGGGVGEVEDARAAVEAVLALDGITRAAVAGYSFGAAVALRLAASEPRLFAAAAVAPPLLMFEAPLARSIHVPQLIVAGERDDFCPRGALDRFAAALERSTLTIVPEADHFFAGQEQFVATTVADFLASI